MRTSIIGLCALALAVAPGCSYFKSEPTKPTGISIVQTSKARVDTGSAAPQDEVCGQYRVGALDGTVSLVVHHDGVNKRVYVVGLSNEDKNRTEFRFVPVMDVSTCANRRDVEAAFVDLYAEIHKPAK